MKQKRSLSKNDFRVDYIAIADASTLMPMSDHGMANRTLVALIAAFQHEVRLIDNMH